MKRLHNSMKKDKEYEIFISLRKPLNPKQQNDLTNDLRKYNYREAYFLTEDEPKHRREWFAKKSKER